MKKSRVVSHTRVFSALCSSRVASLVDVVRFFTSRNSRSSRVSCLKSGPIRVWHTINKIFQQTLSIHLTPYLPMYVPVHLSINATFYICMYVCMYVCMYLSFSGHVGQPLVIGFSGFLLVFIATGPASVFFFDADEEDAMSLFLTSFFFFLRLLSGCEINMTRSILCREKLT